MPELTLTTSVFEITFEADNDGRYFRVEVFDLSKTKLDIIKEALKAIYGKGIDYGHYGLFQTDTNWWNYYIIPYDEKKTVTEAGSDILKTMNSIFESLRFDAFRFRNTNKKKAILKLIMSHLWHNRNSKGKLIGKDRLKSEIVSAVELKPMRNRMRHVASRMRTYSKVSKDDSINMAKLLLS